MKLHTFIWSTIFGLVLCLACQDNSDTGHRSSLICNSNDLAFEVADECNSYGEFLICNSFVLEDIHFLEPDDFNWIPEACRSSDDRITFSSITGQETVLRIHDKKHYIEQSNDLLNCSTSYEHAIQVCQKNEIFRMQFLNSYFGHDTIYFEIKRFVSKTIDDVPSNDNLLIKLYQLRNGTNVANFYHTYHEGSNDFDNWAKTYHNDIQLNDQNFSNVIELKVGSSINAIPHTRLYIKEGLGLMAFEIQETLWIKS